MVNVHCVEKKMNLGDGRLAGVKTAITWRKIKTKKGGKGDWEGQSSFLSKKANNRTRLPK
jgi:hypothetical protein